MADPFGMVKVGKMEWLLRKNTPASRIFNIVGASVALTLPALRPSATKMTTLRCLARSSLSCSFSLPVAGITSNKIPMKNRAEKRFIRVLRECWQSLGGGQVWCLQKKPWEHTNPPPKSFEGNIKELS